MRHWGQERGCVFTAVKRRIGGRESERTPRLPVCRLEMPPRDFEHGGRGKWRSRTGEVSRRGRVQCCELEHSLV